MPPDSLPTSSQAPLAPTAATPPAPNPTDTLEGRRIGPCVIERRAGGPSGMGVVYKAVHDLHGVVAFKDVARAGADEVELHRRLHHDHILRLIDAGRHETPEMSERTHLVLEWADGGTILEYATNRELNRRQRIALFIEAARGVAYLHSMGGLHLDLKPANILIVNGVAKVADFGVSAARLKARPRPSGGTPAYMAPEQLSGLELELDARADIYALGVVLHEMCYGRRPHAEPNASGRPPVDPGDDEPPGLWRVIAKALAPRAEDRYRHVNELIGELEPLAATTGWRRVAAAAQRRRGFWATVVALPVIGIVSIAVATAGTRAAQRYTSLEHRHLDRLGAAAGSPLGDPSVPPKVLVLAAAPAEEMVELGRSLDLPSVDTDQRSWRSVYARVIDEAAAAGAIAAVFDLQFRFDSPDIPVLAAAIKRARDEHRMSVVTGEFDWPLDVGVPPATHPTLLEAGAIPGTFMIGQTSGTTVAVPRAARRPGGPLVPSLTTAAFAAAHRPGKLARLRMSEDEQRLVLEFTEPTPPFRASGPTEEMPVTALVHTNQPEAHGRVAGDITYFSNFIPFPDGKVAAARTLTLPEFFALTPGERASHAARSVVFVFNPGAEGVFPTTTTPLAYSHVALLEQMLAQPDHPAPLPRTPSWLTGALVGLGVCAGMLIARRVASAGVRVMAAVLVSGLAWTGAWGLAPTLYSHGMYTHPIFLGCAFTAALACAALVHTAVERKVA